MKNFHTWKIIALSSLTALAICCSADAALIATGISSTTQTTYDGTISTTDLLAGVTPATSGTYAGDSNGINDGVSVASSLTATGGNIYLSTNGNVTMTFDLTGSVTGYNITSIDSIAGWNTNAQHHAAQFYEVLVSAVGSAAYTSLNLTGGATSGGKVSYDPFGSGQGATKVTITDDSSGIIASGVDSIRFILTHQADGLDNDTVYHEIDVFGAATAVPEPSVALLGGLGLIALMRRRR